MFLIFKDKDLLRECGYFKSDINGFCLEFDYEIIEKNQYCLEYIKGQGESLLGKIFFDN